MEDPNTGLKLMASGSSDMRLRVREEVDDWRRLRRQLAGWRAAALTAAFLANSRGKPGIGVDSAVAAMATASFGKPVSTPTIM
ncbi:hypothetical protein RB195_007189 [Necator americanus]|uniref:Uncharacterized protein n=1 Tax=Necator americanus TaxID=51031 RepID=A0ABR1BZC8_NECAM